MNNTVRQQKILLQKQMSRVRGKNTPTHTPSFATNGLHIVPHSSQLCHPLARKGDLEISSLHTSHSTLHTLHFTLHTPHLIVHTSHSALHTSHSTLHAPHSWLHTSHFTLHTSHCTLHTSHCTLHTLHFTLHTSHSTLSPLTQPHLFSLSP